MADRDDNAEIVEIDFEVGHTSTIRAEPTNHNPPRTHDWKVYLRSTDVNADLSCLIQRCVFYLHPEFPNHRRELKATPFAIHESGYAGFHLPIEIYFHTKKEPKKYRIEYDLDLHTNVEGHPQRQKESYVRKYRCTFCNPDPEFRQKILLAGGKIRDNNSISNKNHENDESNNEQGSTVPIPSESIIRHSSPPTQKRPFSPVPSSNTKKVKVEQSMVNTKKKITTTTLPVIKNEPSNKTTVNNNPATKKSQPIKTLPPTEDKPTKPPTINVSSEDSKSRLITKIKPEIQSSTNVIIKKKEAVPSPSKPNISVTVKKPIPPPSNKPSQKPSVKTEPTSTSNKSPPPPPPANVNIKQEPSPNPTPSSNSTTSTVSISSLKRIPKKVAPPPPPPPPLPSNGKRVRSPMTPPSTNRNSDRDSYRHLSSKKSSSSKRDRPITPPPSSSSSSSTNHSGNVRNSSSSNRSGKHSGSSRARSRSRSRSRSHSRNRSSHHSHHSNRSHHSSSSSRHSSQQKDRPKSSSSSSHHSHRRTPTPSKSTRSPSRSDLPPSTTAINTPQSRPDSVEPSNTCSPSTHVFPSEDDHTQTPMDIDGQSDDDVHLHRPIPLSDEHEQTSPFSSTKILPTRNFHSDQSDSLSDGNESHDEHDDDDNDDENNNNNNNDDDEDFPSVLTDDDLRSKLIFIYNRFTSNTPHDLSTFVTFFKRHQLIDISTKTNNDMFTYDLFSLNAFLIEELANDLGYHNHSLLTRIEQ